MWKWGFIASMCITMATLADSLFQKMNILQDKKNNKEIMRLKGENNDLKTTNTRLRELRRQEKNNNTLLTNKNKVLLDFKTEIENIINGKREAAEKVEKIKELLYK